MLLKRVGPASLAKFMGVFYGLTGLIIGAFITLGMVVGIGSRISDPETPAILTPLFGVAAVVALPIFYGVLGLVFGFVAGWIFNFTMKLTGGLEIVLE